MVQRFKQFIPLPLRHRARLLLMRSQTYVEWSLFQLNRLLKGGKWYVYYGHNSVPQHDEPANGGRIKCQRMQKDFPNSSRYFNLLYLVSSWLPENYESLLQQVNHESIKCILNQNGVAYPAWDKNWERSNQPYAKVLQTADYVFYQSQFAKLGADRFLGERRHNWEILYNAVDTSFFTPSLTDPAPQQLTVLIAGTQQRYYRFETAIRSLAIVLRSCPRARLLIAGKLGWLADEAEALHSAKQLIREQGVAEHVSFLGPYTQQEAPSLLRQAHILLHTQYNDVCPGLVVEAMACGLPVVYSHSGGVPELVGDVAGIGVPSELSWEREIPPDPVALAEGVLRVFERRSDFSEAARQRTVDRFDLRPWLQRHREVFTQLLTH